MPLSKRKYIIANRAIFCYNASRVITLINYYKYASKEFNLSHTRTERPDQSQFALHTHSTAELYYFVQGSGTFHIEGSAYRLEPGDLLLMQSAESHYIELDTTQPYERKVLHFNMGALAQVDPHGYLLAPFLARTPGKQNLYKPRYFRGGSCAHYWDTMMQAEPDPSVSVFAGLIPLLHELCTIQSVSVHEETSAPDSAEYRIVRYLNENIHAQISLNDICQQFYISKSQLCRVFRSCTGVTVKHYITVKRMVRAKELLDAGQHPTHIYTQCGFNDYSSFYRAYRKYYGISPGKE